jgi:hypothetical protein
VTTWTEWEIVRHQVTICGRVVDAQSRPMAKVTVGVLGPKEFASRVASAKLRAGPKWDNLRERLDRTETRADGIYFFLDLPSGKYEVRAGEAGSGSQGGEKAVGISARRDGLVKAAVADFAADAV